jgi:hypothetical protein
MSELQRSITPGEWIMFDRTRKIAVIRLLHIGRGKEPMFRSVTWAEESAERALIGYFPHLEMAAEVTWREWSRARNGKSRS